MKHSFFSTLLLPGALAYLLSAFGTKLQTGEMAQNTAKTSLSQPAPNALTCTLPAPASFSGERTGSTTASLSWAAVTDAGAYRLKVFDLSTNELVFDNTEYGTTKYLSGLASGTTYRCVLASVCPGGSASEFVIIVDIL
ncbi:MAG: hypothetical protein DYG98_12550 [Haliscomenobacteraceae bacterium CHB4]|nr:hypothetical protein [Saprospiraceae bacterium]MCE7923881.1 hypothetical protein [Haliscomenobacteraceae bacterium CHB4]